MAGPSRQEAMPFAAHERCGHAYCPCYLDGLRTGGKPYGTALLRALEQVLATEQSDEKGRVG